MYIGMTFRFDYDLNGLSKVKNGFSKLIIDITLWLEHKSIKDYANAFSIQAWFFFHVDIIIISSV